MNQCPAWLTSKWLTTSHMPRMTGLVKLRCDITGGKRTAGKWAGQVDHPDVVAVAL
jgi:hypothetical protein